MNLLAAIVSLFDKHLDLLLMWLYNKKVDEVKKLETQVAVIKEETEIAHSIEKYETQKEISDEKILSFKEKMAEYKGEKHD